MKRLRRPLAILLALPLLGGCAAAGAGGAAAGGLIQAAMYLAMLIGPLYLSYYLLKKDE